MTDVKEHIVKVVLCTNDRCNQNDDTSDCRFVIEPVQNVESFCLRRALLPLSSYSFSPTDQDATLRIQNEGAYPYPYFQAGTPTTDGAKYCNYFLIPTGVTNPTQTFTNASKDVSVKVSWCYLENGDTLSIGYMTALGVYVKHIVRSNTTGSIAYYTHQQIIDSLNYGLQVDAGYGASNVVVKSSAYGGAPPQAGDTIQNPQLAGQTRITGTPYFYCDFRKGPSDASWNGVSQFDIWLNRPSQTYESIIGVFVNTGTNAVWTSNLILSTTIRVQSFETLTVSFDVAQTYTIAQIISTFNADPVMTGILGIQLTQNATDPTGLPLDRIYLYNNFGVTIPDRFKSGVKWLWGNDTLGWEYNNVYQQWNNTMGPFNPANILIGTKPYSLTPNVIVRSVQLGGSGITDESTFITLVKMQALPSSLQVDMQGSIDYYNINQGSENPWTGADLVTLDPSSKLCYGFRFTPGQTTYQLGGVLLSNTELPTASYDAQYWLDRHATFEPTTDTNTWAVNNQYYFHSNPSDQFISLPVNTIVTLTTIQTALNLIDPPLVATIVPASNTITFVNSGQGTYRIRANKTLGIYDDRVGDQAFEIKPTDTRTTLHPIDLSCNNSFMAIGLNLYHDGRCSLGLNDAKSGSVQRPSRKNIVATVHNLGSQVYGGHMAYVNDSDAWLPSYVKDLSEMHLTVYNDKLETALLNKQDVYLEVDLKCRVYRV